MQGIVCASTHFCSRAPCMMSPKKGPCIAQFGQRSHVLVPPDCVHFTLFMGCRQKASAKLQGRQRLVRITWLTVRTLSATATAPFRMLTAGPLMDAQLGYSHDKGSYLHREEVPLFLGNTGGFVGCQNAAAGDTEEVAGLLPSHACEGLFCFLTTVKLLVPHTFGVCH